MATIEQKASGMLLFAQNGTNRPLHQDRQVLRASDLTLEQATQDQMLARARRYLHGWGVVSGFVPTVAESNVLQVGPGYGVTPLGDELFLPQQVTLEDVITALILCCGPGAEGCEQIDPEMIARHRAEPAIITVTGWLVARPGSRDASPRAGVPQDCAHPASILLPSRRCGGVEFAVMCTLPPTHQPRQPACEELMPFVCGSERTGGPPLPWETPLPAEANFLVIARLTATLNGLTATTDARRALWPVSLMQDWIGSCICPLLSRNDTRPTVSGGATTITGGTHDDTVSPRPAAVPGSVSGAVTSIPGSTVPPDIIHPPPVVVIPPIGPSGPIPPEEMAGIRDRLTGPVLGIVGVGAARSQALAGVGVNTQGDFMTAPVETLATALNLPTARVTAMKQDLNAKNNLGLTFQ
jgi:hypothetical protein